MEAPLAPDVRSSPIRTATRLAFAGYATVAVMFAVAVHDLSNANRPHELKYVWVVYTLAAVGTLIALAVLAYSVRAWRRQRPSPLRAGHVVGWVLSVSYVVLVLGYWAVIGWAVVAG